MVMFTALSADRTNQMTKTHNDLDAILQLLQEASLIVFQLELMDRSPLYSKQFTFLCVNTSLTVALSIRVYYMLSKAVLCEERCKSKKEKRLSISLQKFTFFQLLSNV